MNSMINAAIIHDTVNKTDYEIKKICNVKLYSLQIQLTGKLA